MYFIDSACRGFDKESDMSAGDNLLAAGLQGRSGWTGRAARRLSLSHALLSLDSLSRLLTPLKSSL
jgi:hypothetical protein